MESGKQAPLPAGLYLVLIAVIWLAVTVLVAYAVLAPMVYQARPLGFWVACGALALTAVGAFQLARVAKR